MTLDWPLLVGGLLSGLALGSYAVTAGLRSARLQPSSAGRSRCDGCGISLGFRHTVPLLSFAWLKGVCHSCGVRIDRTHLAGELAGAIVVVTAVMAAPPARAALLVVLGLILVTAATVDLKAKRLPNVLTVVIAAAAMGLAILDGWTSLMTGLAAAAISGLTLILVRMASRARGRGAGLGLGDVKLVAALALWLGAATPMMVVVASLLGLIAAPFMRDEKGRLPFGPMIACAAWVVGLANEWGWTPWAL